MKTSPTRKLPATTITVALLLAGRLTGFGADPQISELRKLLDDQKAVSAKQSAKIARLTSQVEALLQQQSASPAKAGQAAKSDTTALPSKAGILAGVAPAPNTRVVTKDTKVRDLESDFRVPTSPAASALGLNPDTLPKAQIPRELNILNLNGVDVRGNEQTGLAVDIALGQLANLNRGPKGLTVGQYADGNAGIFSLDIDQQWAYWRRVLTRTQLSLAGTRGTGDKDKATRLAFGFNVPLLVSRDVVQTSFARGTTEGARSLNGEKTPASARPFTGDDFLRSVGNTLWEHLDWTLGGYALATAESGGSDFSYGGTTYMSTWNFSVEKPEAEVEGTMLKYFSFVANVTYRDHELVPVSSTTKGGAAASSSAFIAQDTLTLGGGLRVGKDDLNATAFYEWMNFHDASKNSQSNRYGVVVEYQLPNSNLWLTATAGEELGEEHRPNSTFVLGGVKVGLGGDSFTKPAGQ